MRTRHLLIDLDGTLVDPKIGIISSYQSALRELGIVPPDAGELLWTIGPSLRDSLMKFLGPERRADLDEAVRIYRSYYVDQGAMYRDPPYEGIHDALAELHGKGFRMLVATAKAHAYARKIVDHCQLGAYFSGVYGSELDGTRADKAELLRYLLETEKIEADTCLMIGDREHDARAAKANGIAMLGVIYGYGTREELAEHGAGWFCASAKELPSEVERAFRAFFK